MMTQKTTQPAPTHPLNFRQVHLDFHTSGKLPDIGQDFDAERWQQRLKAAAVDSITLFAKCHHGYSYHDTEVGTRHPNLYFDLLQAQYEATKAVGIKAPIYLSAGLDCYAGEQHPDWVELNEEGRVYNGGTPLAPTFLKMDFHSPYLDYLCEQIREVVRRFPDCDGIFLDIIMTNPTFGPWGLKFMEASGLDPENPRDQEKTRAAALEKYFEQATAAVRGECADMPVFHNAGHIPRGQRSILRHFSHLELESLPTGGWGYDHFPLSAKYVCNLGMEVLGMTGKFHTTWGEFGGYKHPNALRYECAAMLAYGAKCSVGDQLHPRGELDPATYEIIGEAYREVAAKESWCRDHEQIFDVGILSSEAERGTFRDSRADEGASRIFLEGHLLFGVIDREMDFHRYRILVLPDEIRIDAELKEKLDAFLERGGSLVLSGESGLWKDRDAFAFDLGADYEGLSPCHPSAKTIHQGHDYVRPGSDYRAAFAASPVIMYERSHRLRVTGGHSLGDVHDPYFNRGWGGFCSHQHTPPKPEPSGYACAVYHNRILYFSHPVFRHYRQYGAVAYREQVLRPMRALLGEGLRLRTNLPSTARLTLTRSPGGDLVLHLLYAPTVSRGGNLQFFGGTLSGGSGIEIIEDLPALHDVTVELDGLEKAVTEVTTFGESETVDWTHDEETLSLHLPKFECHAMVAIRF